MSKTELEKVVKRNQQNIEIGKSKCGYGFTHFAKRDFKKGEIIMQAYGKVIDHQTNHISIRIGYNNHCLPTKWTGRYWNHSCDPNTYAFSEKNLEFPKLIALRNIKKGEEITYSYWNTELDWKAGVDEVGIQCACGALNCAKKIFSFSDLPIAKQKAFKKQRKCAFHIYTQDIL